MKELDHALESILLQIATLNVFCTQRMTQILSKLQIPYKNNNFLYYYNL